MATLTSPLTNDPARCGPNPTGTGALRVVIPANGRENDDKKPPRIAPRNLFDLAAGQDDLFQILRGDHDSRYKWSRRLTVENLTNKEALYNFLLTFSGTHFVTRRARTGLPLLGSSPARLSPGDTSLESPWGLRRPGCTAKLICFHAAGGFVRGGWRELFRYGRTMALDKQFR